MSSLLNILGAIEDNFSSKDATAFLRRNWHYSLYISMAYVIGIFSIQRFMRDRQKCDLRRPLFAWSLMLALFSGYGFYHCGVTLLGYLFEHGWERSVCDRYLVDGRVGVWTFLFVFSKAPELVDTFFIVLRKQKLIFLHWYHHITVFIYCWYHYAYMINAAQWFISMNYFVHAIMYLYYAVRASGWYRPPLWVNMLITSLQLLQMVLGVYINIFIYNRMTADSSWFCDGRVETSYFYVYIAFAMYFSYFVLFAHFFYVTYLSKSNRSKSRSSSKTGQTSQTSSDGIKTGSSLSRDSNGVNYESSYYETNTNTNANANAFSSSRSSQFNNSSVTQRNMIQKESNGYRSNRHGIMDGISVLRH